MAYKLLSRRWAPHLNDYMYKYVVDTVDDVAGLPSCPVNSRAVVASSGAIYMVDASGSWVKHSDGEGTGGSSFDPLDYNLPVLALTGDMSAMTKENPVSLGYTYGSMTGTVEMKWQGSSSLSYEKKNFNATFDMAFEAKDGWGEQSKYCLKANHIDPSHTRNVVSAKLWGDIVRTRTFILDGGNQFRLDQITGVGNTMNKLITVTDDMLITNNNSVYGYGYNYLTGITFPKGTYTIEFEMCSTADCNAQDEVYFGFTNDINTPHVQRSANLTAWYTTVAADQWVWVGLSGIETNLDAANLFLLAGPDGRTYKFRNIKVINEAVTGDSGGSEKLLDAPNAGAIDGFPVILTLNGDFYGLYTFNIPKKGWMMAMNDATLPEAIVSASVRSDATHFTGLATLENDFELEYVADKDNADWVLTSLNTMLQAVIDCDGTNLDAVGEYLDWNSVIDYYAFCALIGGTDNVTKNYLLVTYDGVKWVMSAYDMDASYGLQWHGEAFEPYDVYPTLKVYDHRAMTLVRNYKADALKVRYDELRAGIMSEGNLYQQFSDFAAQIPSTVHMEDVKKWTSIPGSSVNNVAQILNWYRLRVALLDTQLT